MKKVFSLLLFLICTQGFTQTPATPTISIALPSKPTVALAEGAVVSADDGMKELIFRWMPVSPKPSTPVNYRVRVWQLMSGQNEADAIRLNRLIATKDVADQTQIIVEKLVKIPCPNGCRFVWNVQAFNHQGRPIGPNKGVTANATFVVAPKMEEKK